MRALAVLAAAVLPLGACNQNTSIGNDREAQLDDVAVPAPVVPAAAALEDVASAIIKPETMSDADVAALGGRNGRCVVRLTEVAFPSFLYEPGGNGAIKLNGKLIPLPASGPGRFEDGGLVVALRPVDGTGNAGLQAMELIVVPPGAKEEIGYRGYVQCYGT